MAQEHEPFTQACLRASRVAFVEAVIDVGGALPIAASYHFQKDFVALRA